MRQQNKQFYAKLIVFTCILIVGIILIVWVDTPENFGHTGHGYLTMIVGIFIFLGVLILIHGLIVLLRPEQLKNPEKVSNKIKQGFGWLVFGIVVLIIVTLVYILVSLTFLIGNIIAFLIPILLIIYSIWKKHYWSAYLKAIDSE